MHTNLRTVIILLLALVAFIGISIIISTIDSVARRLWGVVMLVNRNTPHQIPLVVRSLPVPSCVNLLHRPVAPAIGIASQLYTCVHVMIDLILVQLASEIDICLL